MSRYWLRWLVVVPPVIIGTSFVIGAILAMVDAPVWVTILVAVWNGFVMAEAYHKRWGNVLYNGLVVGFQRNPRWGKENGRTR